MVHIIVSREGEFSHWHLKEVVEGNLSIANKHFELRGDGGATVFALLHRALTSLQEEEFEEISLKMALQEVLSSSALKVDFISKDFFYHPRFIVSQCNDRFGGKQQEYVKIANQIILQTASLIRKVAPEEAEALFFSILEEHSRYRQALAISHGMQEACFVGRRRDIERVEVIHGLHLYFPYEKCNRQLLAFFAKHIEQAQSRNHLFNIVLEEECLGYRSSWQLRFFTLQSVIDQGWNEVKGFAEFTSLGALYDFKEQNPKEYEKRIQAQVIASLPRKENDLLYCLVSGSMQMEGRKVDLMEYSTWVPVEEEVNYSHYGDECVIDLQKMQEESTVFIRSQAAFFIQPTLNEAAKVFCQVLKRQDTENLKEKMAVLIYLLIQSMHDIRGTSAETEWLIAAIYLALGIEVQVDPSWMQDLAVIANPLLSEFICEYQEKVRFIS